MAQESRPTTTPALRFSYRTTSTGIKTLIGPSDKFRKSGANGETAKSEESQGFFETDKQSILNQTDVAHYFYSPDGKLLALVKRIRSGSASESASPPQPVKIAPSGLPVVTGPPVPENRAIEVYDMVSSSGPTQICRIPPNPDTGIVGIEDLAYFSPLSRYVVTWQPMERVKKGEGNLKIWDVRTGRLLVMWEHASRQGWPVLRWTPNERLLVRLFQGQLQVYNWHEFVNSDTVLKAPAPTTPEEAEAPILRDSSSLTREVLHDQQGFTEFSVTHSAVAAFIPEKKGRPAKVMVFRLNDFSDVTTKHPKPKKQQANAQQSTQPAQATQPTNQENTAVPLIASQEPVATKSFFKADEVNMIWHSRGIGVLILASTVQDSSGKSYYGETALYYLQADGKFDCNIVLEKQGPIHAVAWNPKGNGDFAVTYGYQPASTTLFDRKCRPTAHLGSASRNTLIWSPHGRVLCVGGFGALNGEMDFWDTVNLVKLGTCRAYCSSSQLWSPDGRYLMASVLFPRMRVDNGIKIFNIFGQQVWSSGPLNELWQASWQPLVLHRETNTTQSPHTYPKPPQPITQADIYPDIDFEKLKAQEGSDKPVGPGGAAKAPAKSGGGTYRHPHWSGRGSSAMSHQRANDGPQKLTVQRTIPGATPAPQPKLPVGYQPVAAPSKNGAKNKARRERRKKKQAGNSTADASDEADMSEL